MTMTDEQMAEQRELVSEFQAAGGRQDPQFRGLFRRDRARLAEERREREFARHERQLLDEPIGTAPTHLYANPHTLDKIHRLTHPGLPIPKRIADLVDLANAAKDAERFDL